MPTLPGIDPLDPTPEIRRHFVFGAGDSTGAANARPYLLLANKLTGGSETVDTLGTHIVDDTDCIARFDERSEIYGMYRQIADVDSDGKVYAIAVTESAGAAAFVELTASTASDAATTVAVHVLGAEYQYPIANGDTVQVTAEGIRDMLGEADDGRLQVTATAAIDGAGPDWATTISAATKGPRGDLIIGSTATRGIRVRAIGNTVNAQTVVKKLASFSAGTTDDDHTAAIAELEAAVDALPYYIVSAAHMVSGVTATDNMLGETMDKVRSLALPADGRDMRLLFASVGTNAEAVAVCTAAALNSVYGHCIWAENNDWTPAMIAAHTAANVRIAEIAYPSANLNGLTTNDVTRFKLPKPFVKADNATKPEIKTALNNGISPCSFNGGRARLVRFITTRSLNDQSSNDYRAREGHIPSAIHFTWDYFRGRYEATRQPNADSDPPDGQPPAPLTTTPGAIKDLGDAVIDDLTAPKPLINGVLYPGPILKPSAAAAMKEKMKATYLGGGAFDVEADFKAVEHNIKLSATFRETGQAY